MVSASLPGLSDAHWFDSFGTRARPAALAVFDGFDETIRASLEARVLADRARWQTHGERNTSPFYTLGLPTYIRGAKPSDPHTQRFLRDSYADAHAVLVDRMRSILGTPVELSPHDSAPGFHIFESPEGAAHPAVGMHLDAQHRHLEVGDADKVTNHRANVLSITAVIRSDGGSGLDYVPWPHIPGMAMRTEPTRHLEYEPGRLVVHYGLFAHTVAAFGAAQTHQTRITFQAHAIQRSSGAWRLYW